MTSDRARDRADETNRFAELFARIGSMSLETFEREGDVLEFSAPWAYRSLYLVPDARQAESLARCRVARSRILLAAELMILFDYNAESPLRVDEVLCHGLTARVRAVICLPRSSDPWPNALPGLGPRNNGPFDPCRDCGSGSWERYGDRVLCLECAQVRERGPHGHGDSSPG